MSAPQQDGRSPLPLLPLRGGLVLPGQQLSIPVGRRKSKMLLRELNVGDELLIAAQRDRRTDDPGEADLFDIVTRVVVRGVEPRGRIAQLLVEGLQRQRLTKLVHHEPFWWATAEDVNETIVDEDAATVAVDAARDLVADIADEGDADVLRVVQPLQAETDAGRMADALAPALGVPFEVAIEVLGTLDKGQRLRRLLDLLDEFELRRELNRDVERRIREDVSKSQREHLLRTRLKAIQDELGDGGDDEDRLKQRLQEKHLPDEVRTVVDKQLAQLGRTQGAEQAVVRNHLEWIADLPWTETADEGDVSLSDVADALDANHRGLDDIKERVLEHLAVRQRRGPGGDVTILCLAGPPGTGKTSLGQSIADALGRPFVRVALGGVRDEAEVRGHRRTYVGARPGRIVHALKKAEVNNPVFLLDEIDKMGRGWSGDPEAALLEVLDPEQNATFTDHYMELPLDLSQVLFICTANDLSQLSAPLRDRLEIIELSGYVTDEKVAIAKDHLLPKALQRVGLEDGDIDVDDALLRDVIEGWTREAGVRQLTRALEKLARAQLLNMARAPDTLATVHLEMDDVTKALGKRRFFPEVKERTALPGVATGLAWTPVGGDILFIESSRARGKGRVEVTGQLGDVMSESARAALAWVKAHDDKLGFDAADLEHADLHIHVPQGAVPKDGPSAGVALITALSSLLSGRRVRSDTAMTGEITLRGRVLPVGGIKAKVLAAHRAGIERVVLPKKNERDVDDVPEEARKALEFIFVDDVADALDATLEKHVQLDDDLGGAGFNVDQAPA